ncbi:hypothetical protein ACVWYN_001521 [Pedobacter sp. UYP24]
MELLIYLLKVSACLVIFYGFYHLFLRKLTFFSVNRIYLLGTLIVSMVIPSIEFQIQGSGYQSVPPIETSIYAGKSDQGQQVTISSNSISINVEEEKLSNLQNWDWEKIIIGIYWVVAIGMVLSILFQLLRVLWYARHIDQRMGKLQIIYKSEGFTDCSFWNYVFVDQHDRSDEEISQIIKHESVHVMCAHSVDKLIISLFKAMLWFNPIIYFYNYAMEQAHEYEADKRTSSEIGNTVYASLLLSMAVKNSNPAMVHSFVKHPIKERIQMLFSNESKNIKKLMYVAVLPIAIVLLCTFCVQVVYAKMPEIIPAGVLDLTKEDNNILDPALPQNEIKVKKVLLKQHPTDSLLMIDYAPIEKVLEVTIDGKTYDKAILYKISPRCVDYNQTIFRDGKLMLTTTNKEIFNATEIDRYNKITFNKSDATRKFYVRSTLKNQDGSNYDWIQIKLNGVSKSGGGVALKRGAEVVLIIDGKRYNESVLKTVGNEKYAKGYWISFSGGPAIAEQYGKRYDSKIELKRAIPPRQDAVNMPLSFIARDSVTTSFDKTIVHLYGAATIKYQYNTITADEVVYNTKDMTGLAKVASMSNAQSGANSMVADSIKFDLRNFKFNLFGLKK